MGDELLDRDDYAGPGGARLVLRDQRCELAILETARGGLLRRGLAVEHADAALITNIAADHLGEYGIHTVDDLTAVKWSVSQALDQKGRLVLNAEDPQLMARASDHEGPLVLFSLDPRNPRFGEHVAAGGTGFTLHRGRMTRVRGDKKDGFLSARSMPLAYGGAARHNIANGLAAAAIADSVGISLEHIAAGLRALGNEDNPGRANVYRIGDVTVLVDFAHNPAGLNALLPLALKLPARRRMLVTGQAGDRSDDDIREFAEAAGAGNFDRILVKRMDGHARGREEGEVAEIMRAAFRDMGYPARAVGLVKTELDAARAALRWAKPGDVVLFLSHEKRDATQTFFQERAGKDKSKDKAA
jgi:UDP-N-acetylmuramyl tripeptide synthase